MAAAKMTLTNLRTILLAGTLALLAAGSFGVVQQASADGANTITFTKPPVTTNTITFTAPATAQITLAPPPSDAGSVTILAPEPNTGDASLAAVSPAGVTGSADAGATPSQLTEPGN